MAGKQWNHRERRYAGARYCFAGSLTSIPESKLGDMMLPRALSAVMARNASTSALQSYIQAYLSVQVRMKSDFWHFLQFDPSFP